MTVLAALIGFVVGVAVGKALSRDRDDAPGIDDGLIAASLFDRMGA